MTERQRVAAAVGAAATTGVVTLLLARANTWYAWLLVAGSALFVAYLAHARPPHLAQEQSTSSQVPAAVPPLVEPVLEPSAVDNERASFAVRVTHHSHIYAMLNPSSGVGPQPLYIPLSGYNLYLELVVLNASAVVLHGQSAQVTARAPLKANAVSIDARPWPIFAPGVGMNAPPEPMFSPGSADLAVA